MLTPSARLQSLWFQDVYNTSDFREPARELAIFWFALPGRVSDRRTCVLKAKIALYPRVLKTTKGAGFQQTGVCPYPLGAGSARPNPKKGRAGARDRKPFIHRVYSAQRGIGTMVSDHGLWRGQTMG